MRLFPGTRLAICLIRTEKRRLGGIVPRRGLVLTPILSIDAKHQERRLISFSETNRLSGRLGAN
jgi:hypothetical protein